jgi:5'(3')-deoxyribonucleotidase
MADKHYVSISVDLDSTLADTPAIAVGPFEAGTIICPASMTGQTINCYVSDSETGTYRVLYDSDGSTAIQIINATQQEAQKIPTAALDGVTWLKLLPASDDVAGVKLTFN